MKIKILLLYFLAYANIFAQTPVYPLRDATVNFTNATSDVMWFGYTPVIKTGNVYELYYTTHGDLKYATSQTGTNWSFISPVQAPSNEAIIKKDGFWYMGFHRTYNGVVSFHTSQSSDGINFTPGVPKFESGEDMSFIVVSDTFYCYIRPSAVHPQRKIGLMKSKDFSTWSPIQTIMAVDTNDYKNVNSPDFRKQFYNMCVFRNGADWWGVINVLRVGDLGQDQEQNPPYNTYEHTVEPQLVYSTDGVNWMRTNNRKAFIPRVAGMMEVFGIPTVINNTLYIYTIESARRHTSYESANVNGRYFSMWRYSLSMNDLNSWKPDTKVNATLAIEGLLNTNGKHNSNDSATIYIRGRFAPYAIVDSAKSKIDSSSLVAAFSLKNVNTGTYYVSFKGDNFMETWSKNPVNITRYGTVSMNFTTSSAAAYGNNLIFKNGKYCMYSGDLDNNGIIELVDVLTTFNDADNFSIGSLITDLNGDNIVDLQDVAIVNNNAGRFIFRKRP